MVVYSQNKKRKQQQQNWTKAQWTAAEKRTGLDKKYLKKDNPSKELYMDKLAFARKNKRYITDIQKGKFGNIGGAKDDTQLSGFMDPAHAKSYFLSMANGPTGVGPAAFSQLSQLEKEQKDLGVTNADLTSTGLLAGRKDAKTDEVMGFPGSRNQASLEERKSLLATIEAKNGRLPDNIRRDILNTTAPLANQYQTESMGQETANVNMADFFPEQELPPEEQVTGEVPLTPEEQARQNELAILNEGEGRTGDDGKGFLVDNISTLGGIAGGIGGSFITPVAGTAVGAGLGAAAGEMIENIIMGEDISHGVLSTGLIDAALTASGLKLFKALKPVAKASKIGKTMWNTNGLFTDAASKAASGRLPPGFVSDISKTGGGKRFASFVKSGEYASFPTMNRFGPINTKSASLITESIKKVIADKKFKYFLMSEIGSVAINGYVDWENIQNMTGEAERQYGDGNYEAGDQMLEIADELADVDMWQALGWLVPLSGPVKALINSQEKNDKLRERFYKLRANEFVTPKMEAQSQYYTDQAVAREQAKGEEIRRQRAMS